MATSDLDFGAQIDDWVKQTQARQLAVFREATQRTVALAQSRIPVDTGFARASVRASLGEMPAIDPKFLGDKHIAYAENMGNVTLTLIKAQLGQTIYVGWTASYVQYLENGHSKQAPSGFVGLAALQWQQTVDQVALELKDRVMNV